MLFFCLSFRFNIIKRSELDKIEDNDKVVIDGIVETIPSVFRFKKKMDR